MDPGDTTVAVVAVYSTCLTGLKALTDAVEVPRGTEALWQQMRIQAARLRIWGEQWGMNEYTDCSTGRPASDTELLAYKNLREFLTEWPATGELMEKALYGIVEFLVNKRKLEEKFGFARWKVPVADPYDRSILDLWNGTSTLPLNSKSRLESIRRAFSFLGTYRYVLEVESFEGFIQHLMRFNDMLWNLCPPNTRALMSRALMTELLSNVTDITLLLHISRAAEEEGRLLTGISRQLYRTTYQTLSKAAKLRARLNLDPFLRGKILNAPQELSLADFEIVSSSVWDGKDIRLAVGRHPHRVHIVEFKKMHVAGTTSRKSSIWLHQLAEMLCAHDKPPEFQLLECRGYFVDRREGRWGFVFDLPPHCGEYFLPPVLSRRDLHYRKPTSLKELLRKQEGDAIDLATRFDLAKKLVAAVATIHASGFMHRNIRASSVLFFPDTSSDGDGPSKSRRKNLQQPFLQGWGYIDALDIVPSSYPQKPSNSTSLIIKTTATTLEEIDFYQHPYLTRYPNAPYCRAFDLYSLGLLLLEIGLWQPIATFTDGVDVVYQSREDAAERFKAHLERNYVADLKGQAGGRYEEVVRRLLGMWSYGEEKEREVEMRVVWEVVKRLEECVV